MARQHRGRWPAGGRRAGRPVRPRRRRRPGRDGPRRRRAARHRGQQRGRQHAREFTKTGPATSSRPSSSTCHGPRAHPGRRPPHGPGRAGRVRAAVVNITSVEARAAAATWPTARPRRRCRTTPGWRPATSRPHQGQRHRGRLDRHVRPRRRATDPGLRTTMEETTPSAASATPTTSPRSRSSWPPTPAAYVTGTVVDADGGLDRPNLDLGFPRRLSRRRTPLAISPDSTPTTTSSTPRCSCRAGTTRWRAVSMPSLCHATSP